MADVPDFWLAHMNLILAIGAKQSHLISADWAGHDRDHMLYMRRAVRLLALNDTVMIISVPELRLVQAVSELKFDPCPDKPLSNSGLPRLQR